MDPKKVDAITNWPTPTCICDIQSFLGFANFYQNFIANFAKLIVHMTRLTHKGTTFHWNSAAQTAFDALKVAYTTAPVLQHFRPDRPITLKADASDFALGASISQPDDNGILHPVTYYSRKLSRAEVNYKIYDKELLAIVTAFKKWRAYLEGAFHCITIFSDHKNLEYFSSTKILNQRQERWAQLLANFDFVIHYKPGKSTGKIDALSCQSDYRLEGGESIPQALLKPHHFAAFAHLAATSSLHDPELRQCVISWTTH